MNPLVSVILPVYNGEKYLAAALDSVETQDYTPLEVIVVDDGSTDGTAQIAQGRAGVQTIYQANQGNGAAKNAGLAASHGDFVAFLDADDVWLPGKVRAQMDYLIAHPETGFVLCRMEAFLEPGAPWPTVFNEAYYRGGPAAFVPSALLARRAVFNQVGLFDASYRISNDSDWFLRARDTGVPVVVLPEVWLQKRIHASNQSSDGQATAAEILHLVKASMDRRRHGGG